jgi:transposase
LPGATSPHHARLGLVDRPRAEITRDYIGINVSKATLDVAARPGGETWTVANDETGVQDLILQLRALTPTLGVLEATSGFEVRP